MVPARVVGAMSTLVEIKAAAATLPAEERSDLITWLGEANDVAAIRSERLRRAIQVGVDAIKRGDVAPLDMESIKSKARARFEGQEGS